MEHHVTLAKDASRGGERQSSFQFAPFSLMESDPNVEPLVDRALADERVFARLLGAPDHSVAAAGRRVRQPPVGPAAGHL